MKWPVVVENMLPSINHYGLESDMRTDSKVLAAHPRFDITHACLHGTEHSRELEDFSSHHQDLGNRTTHGATTPRSNARALMPREVPDLSLYLDGKIDQWYVRQDGKGVVFTSLRLGDSSAVALQPLGEGLQVMSVSRVASVGKPFMLNSKQGAAGVPVSRDLSRGGQVSENTSSSPSPPSPIRFRGIRS